MKVMVLGGAGMVGRVVVRDLGRSGSVDRIGVGDFDLDGAQAQAAAAGARATAVQVDITRPDQLAAALAGYDVVVNTVGPFYRNASRVLDACLSVRAHYVDVCDDYDAAELLLGFDARCQQAGITAITASGASPGITNMLGALGASRMDQAEEIHTAWAENISDAGGVVVWWHGMHMASGDVPQFLDGQWVRVPALSGAVEVEFAAPMGRWPVYYVGHPEPVTLPRYIRGVRTVTNRGNCWPAIADIGQLLKPYADLGLLSTEPLTIGEVPIVRRDFTVHHLMSVFQDQALAPSPDEPHFAIHVDVRGHAGGLGVQYVYDTHVADTSEATGVSASICAQMIASGAITRRGACAPEGCVDPGAFFRALAERGVQFTETRTVTQPLSV